MSDVQTDRLTDKKVDVTEHYDSLRFNFSMVEVFLLAFDHKYQKCVIPAGIQNGDFLSHRPTTSLLWDFSSPTIGFPHCVNVPVRDSLKSKTLR